MHYAHKLLAELEARADRQVGYPAPYGRWLAALRTRYSMAEVSDAHSADRRGLPAMLG